MKCKKIQEKANVHLELQNKIKVQNLKEKGITLTALVVTIIILLILVGVTISQLSGENGLIKKAIKSRTQYEVEYYKEQVEIARGDAMVDNQGKATLDELLEKIEEKKVFEGGHVEKVDETKAKATTKEGYIIEITEEGVKGIVDKTPPTVPNVSLTKGNGEVYNNGTWTNKNITVLLSSIDNESGVKEYEYSTDKSNIEGIINSTWNINNDMEQTIYFRAVDNAGNKGEWTSAYTLKRHTHTDSCYTERLNGNSNIWSDSADGSLQDVPNPWVKEIKINENGYYIEANGGSYEEDVISCKIFVNNAQKSSAERFHQFGVAGNDMGVNTSVDNIYLKSNDLIRIEIRSSVGRLCYSVYVRKYNTVKELICTKKD